MGLCMSDPVLILISMYVQYHRSVKLYRRLLYFTIAVHSVPVLDSLLVDG